MRLVPAFYQERADVFMKLRVDKCWGDLVHWDENEPSEVGTRVRDGQKRRVGLFVPVKKQV